jgi:hypothetical protein
MAKFIVLHEKCGEEVYVNIEQICFVKTVNYHTVNEQKTSVTQVVVSHGFIEVEESKTKVMDRIRMVNRGLMGE